MTTVKLSFAFNLLARFRLCQTAVQNSNSKRQESVTWNQVKSRMEACYSELILLLSRTLCCQFWYWFQ